MLWYTRLQIKIFARFPPATDIYRKLDYFNIYKIFSICRNICTQPYSWRFQLGLIGSFVPIAVWNDFYPLRLIISCDVKNLSSVKRIEREAGGWVRERKKKAFFRDRLISGKRIVSKPRTRWSCLIENDCQSLEWRSSLICAMRRINFLQDQKYFSLGIILIFCRLIFFENAAVPRLIKRYHWTFLYFLHVVACEILFSHRAAVYF